jgi:hypothetical protein
VRVRVVVVVVVGGSVLAVMREHVSFIPCLLSSIIAPRRSQPTDTEHSGIEHYPRHRERAQSWTPTDFSRLLLTSGTPASTYEPRWHTHSSDGGAGGGAGAGAARASTGSSGIGQTFVRCRGQADSSTPIARVLGSDVTPFFLGGDTVREMRTHSIRVLQMVPRAIKKRQHQEQVLEVLQALCHLFMHAPASTYAAGYVLRPEKRSLKLALFTYLQQPQGDLHSRESCHMALRVLTRLALALRDAADALAAKGVVARLLPLLSFSGGISSAGTTPIRGEL